MKSIVVIDSISRANGGLFDAERALHQRLCQVGVETVVFGLHDEFANADSAAWKPLEPRTFPPCAPGFLGRSPELQQALLAEPADLVYRAGLWRWPSRYALQWSRHHKKPEMIAPHGMLDAWAVKNAAWKKKLALWFYEREHLQNAACLRALCEAEAQAIRAFGLKNPIATIPNGIDLPVIPKSEMRKPKILKAPWDGMIESGRKVLLFLGRIHPKKGLANLLRAWAALDKSEVRSQKSEWILAIAGWDQGGHEGELKRLCAELQIPIAESREHKLQRSGFGLQPSLLFLGPQFGEEKAACYRNCDAFILPSFSEGLPMVVLEAWAYAKPVLMTPECNIPEGFGAEAALRIAPDVERIGHGLRELFHTPQHSLLTLGENGRRLAYSRFTWPKIVLEMRAVYHWLLGGGPRPECVQMAS